MKDRELINFNNMNRLFGLIMPIGRDCKNNQLSLLNFIYQTMLSVNSARPNLPVFKVFKLFGLSCTSARMLYDFGKKSVNCFFLFFVPRFSVVLQKVIRTINLLPSS